MGIIHKEYTFEEMEALEEIAKYKWKDGYACQLCGGTKFYTVISDVPYSRKCQNMPCKRPETPKARTVFERLRIRMDAALALVRILSEAKGFLSVEQLTDTVENRTSVRLKSKAVWELTLKVCDNMDMRKAGYIGNVLFIRYAFGILIRGETAVGIQYSTCLNRDLAQFIKQNLEPNANYSVVDSRGSLLQGRGREVNYDPELSVRLSAFGYGFEESAEERNLAYLKLFTFIMNRYRYEELMYKLTNGYRANRQLLYER